MLQKLRSRHPIDLPTQGFGQKRAILAVLGGIAGLFVLLPLALSPLVGLSAAPLRVLALVGAGFAALVLVLAVAGLIGKHGWDR